MRVAMDGGLTDPVQGSARAAEEGGLPIKQHSGVPAGTLERIQPLILFQTREPRQMCGARNAPGLACGYSQLTRTVAERLNPVPPAAMSRYMYWK